MHRKTRFSQKQSKTILPRYEYVIINPKTGIWEVNTFRHPRFRVSPDHLHWAFDRAKVEGVIPEAVTLDNTPLSVMLKRGYIKELAMTLLPNRGIGKKAFAEQVAYTVFCYQEGKRGHPTDWDSFQLFQEKIWRGELG